MIWYSNMSNTELSNFLNKKACAFLLEPVSNCLSKNAHDQKYSGFYMHKHLCTRDRITLTKSIQQMSCQRTF